MDNLGFSGAASNPYLDKSVNDSLAATTRAYNNTTAPAYTSSMVRSGSFGNSGLQQAQDESARVYQDTIGKQANDMYSNNYQFGQSQAQQQNQFGRSLDQNNSQFGRNLDQNNSQFGRSLDQNQGQFSANLGQQQNQFGRTLDQNQGQFSANLNQNQNQFGRSLDQNMGQFNLNFDRGTYNDAFSQNQTNLGNAFNLIGMQNQGNQQNLGFGTQIQNAPQNYYQGFANTANSIGNGFGSSQGTSSARGNPLMGALGGAQIGSQIGSQFGGMFSNGSNPFNRYSGGSDGYTLPNGESAPT